jgi:hypothetical protein
VFGISNLLCLIIVMNNYYESRYKINNWKRLWTQKLVQMSLNLPVPHRIIWHRRSGATYNWFKHQYWSKTSHLITSFKLMRVGEWWWSLMLCLINCTLWYISMHMLSFKKIMPQICLLFIFFSFSVLLSIIYRLMLCWAWYYICLLFCFYVIPF